MKIRRAISLQAKENVFIAMFLFASTIQAQPTAPVLQVNTEGLRLYLNWSAVTDAIGYRLYYTMYPYQPGNEIFNFDVQTATKFSIDLPQGIAFYVAVRAYDTNRQESEFSNISFVQIQDRGSEYRTYWRAIAKDIAKEVFASNDFLYTQLPDVASCFAGELSEVARNRYLEALKQIRRLHFVSAVNYDTGSNNAVQQSALIQKANNTLTHSPSPSHSCYSEAGFSGSQSSNLSLKSGNSDPVADLIGWVDDAFNLAKIPEVGHRRALLNPFRTEGSYGQVFGASASKVFGFLQNATPDTTAIPDFIAFPYLRYPYLFFSDKIWQRTTPWSLTVIEDKVSLWNNQYDYFSNANVIVKEKMSGRLMIVNNIHSDTKGVGVPNNLSWTVEDWQYDTWYTVTISHLTYASGDLRDIQYDVFIDYKNIIDITKPLELDDRQNGLLIQGSLYDAKDEDSYDVTLVGTVTFLGSSQFSNMAFYIAVYDANKVLIKAKDEPFTLNLQAGDYTVVISNCLQNWCYSGPKNYIVQLN